MGLSSPTLLRFINCKVITHASDRDTALARMNNALNELVIDGIKTNTPFIISCQDSEFRCGGVNIHYLEKKLSSS